MLAKAIDKAYDYHPYGFDNVRKVDGWAVGPTFIVKAPDYEPRDTESVFVTDPHWYLKMTGILSSARDAKEELTAKNEGHPKQEVTTKDKHGALVTRSGGKCTCRALFLGTGAWAELCFPLYSLGKKLKVDSYRTDMAARNLVVYGFRGKELVAVFMAKRFDTCLPTQQ